MHAALNGSAQLGLFFLGGGSDLTNGPVGLAGCLVLSMANLGLFGWRKWRKYDDMNEAD